MLAPEGVAPGRSLAGASRSRTALLLAFAFAVMADPTLGLTLAAAHLQVGIRNVEAEAQEMSE